MAKLKALKYVGKKRTYINRANCCTLYLLCTFKSLLKYNCVLAYWGIMKLRLISTKSGDEWQFFNALKLFFYFLKLIPPEKLDWWFQGFLSTQNWGWKVKRARISPMPVCARACPNRRHKRQYGEDFCAASP